MERNFRSYILLLFMVTLLLTGCNENIYYSGSKDVVDKTATPESSVFIDDNNNQYQYDDVIADEIQSPEINTGVDMPTFSIPEYAGNPYAIINGNNPFFTEEDFNNPDVFEEYSPLDSLGRCGVAYANICQELMPSEKRESISSVKPSGWNNKPYDFVDGGYIFNRCHLIGFQLAGENANELNLITGTRSMNVDGMLPFENMVHDYVVGSGNHVLYRVTPIYEGDNLVANGVLMEAYSVEDSGAGILFNVYCFNVEPGCVIDYATGNNWEETDSPVVVTEGSLYILNIKSKKIHLPDCLSAEKTSDANKREYFGNIEDLINDGYSTCGRCNP